MLTSWAQVHAALASFDVVVARSDGDDTDCHEAPKDCRYSRYLAAQHDPDAGLNTAQYLFFKCRAAILVHIRQGKVQAFVPFANQDYENWWSGKVRFPCGATSPAHYAQLKARSMRKRPEDLLPVHKWWLNGGIVCNVMPANVWGTTSNAELHHMLDECARAANAAGTPLPDATFFLNKRDYPLVRQDGQDPYHRFVGWCRGPDARATATATGAGAGAATNQVPASLLPVFSFYTGASTADCPMPVVEDWKVAHAAEEWAAIRETWPWAHRQPRAVFRGTGTGFHHGQRYALARMTHPLLDVALTGFGCRDRVWLNEADDTVHVHWTASEEDREGIRVQPPMDMREQAATFQYIIYVDGHCAASRFGTLMHTGCVILRVASLQASDCGSQWLFTPGMGLQGVALPDLVAHAEEAGTPWDHVLVSADMQDLIPTLQWLIEHPATAERIAANAAVRAPTRACILQYWETSIRWAHAGTAYRCPDGHGLPATRCWWGAADKRYGALMFS